MPIKPSELPEKFYVDVAVGVDSYDDLCRMYEVSDADAQQLENDAEFQRRLSIAKQSVEDDGRAFRARCRTVVNNSVAHMQQLLKDPDTPASTQLEAFKALAKFGELEPQTNGQDANTGPQLTLNIIAPDGSSGMSLDMNSSASQQSNIIEHGETLTPVEDEPFNPANLPLMSADEAAGWGA